MNSVILLGSTLNLASRLEGIAKNDHIIISKELGDMIQGKYELKKRRSRKIIRLNPLKK
ncbi:MAG TPA: hypothetical protein VE548_00690 [Nitrososphaeraceae archaeon]|jgi:class 3 adenylate cyclase|nr:hypothetical protein [Nitrososphaeraceae archaeon]